MWNDGTPVTADDYVATFQFGANPEHAWDFNWYYQRRDQELAEAVNGEVPVDRDRRHRRGRPHARVHNARRPRPFCRPC